VVTDKVGIIFVHGIGEQRRFEHLDAEVRPFIDAIRRRKSLGALTIEISAGETSTLRADQDTWSAQPVRAVVREGDRETHVFFHEVWWADVNEPYSFWKQVNFWIWGLSIWAFPNRIKKLSGDDVMENPHFPEESPWRSNISARFRLLWVCNIFLMGAVTVGVYTFFAKRLLGFSAPKFVRIFVNYVSAVKLYVQRERFDGGFLDAYGEPPRVSIRRRMIRTLADVSVANYDRWYICAHSLGSVVAQNGLMENAHALPNYLDEKRWQRLNACGLAGLSREGRDVVGKHRPMIPSRPAWLPWEGVVYRDKLFKHFRGLLTYGSPLDKFAAIWPDRVRINVKEKAFHPKAEWINVFDPTDPVAANLDAFSENKSDLKPVNHGYAAYWVLLYSHLRYMTGRRDKNDRLSDRLAEWILSGKKFSLPSHPSPWLWFTRDSQTNLLRRLVASLTAISIYLLLSFGAAFIVWSIWGESYAEAKPGPSIPQRNLNWLGDSPWAGWIRDFVANDWPSIEQWLSTQFDAVAAWVNSWWLAERFFHLIRIIFGAIWHWLGVGFGLLHSGGISLQHAMQGFAGQFITMDGRIWNGIWNSLSYMPTVMAVVLAITIGIGLVQGLFWFLQLKRRGVSPVPVPGGGPESMHARAAAMAVETAADRLAGDAVPRHERAL